MGNFSSTWQIVNQKAARYSHELGVDIGKFWHEFYELIDKGKRGRAKKAAREMFEMLEQI